MDYAALIPSNRLSAEWRGPLNPRLRSFWLHRWDQDDIDAPLQAEMVNQLISHIPSCCVDHQNLFEDVKLVPNRTPQLLTYFRH